MTMLTLNAKLARRWRSAVQAFPADNEAPAQIVPRWHSCIQAHNQSSVRGSFYDEQSFEYDVSSRVIGKFAEFWSLDTFDPWRNPKWSLYETEATSILASLLDANERHNAAIRAARQKTLSETVFDAFMRRIRKCRMSALDRDAVTSIQKTWRQSNYTVEHQKGIGRHGILDIMVSSETFAIIVEAKRSGGKEVVANRRSQLVKYDDWIEDKDNVRQKSVLRILLASDEMKASSRKWIAVSLPELCDDLVGAIITNLQKPHAMNQSLVNAIGFLSLLRRM